MFVLTEPALKTASTNNLSWSLSDHEIKHFYSFKEYALSSGKPMVLWDWKRDKVIDGRRLPESRTVYFSADLAEENGIINISRAYFFLDTRAPEEEITIIKKQVGHPRQIGNYYLDVQTWPAGFDKYLRLRMSVGQPTEYDHLSDGRRLKGRPRITIAPPQLVSEHSSYDLSRFAPFAVCVGSGLSAESELPLLGSIHNLFEVDDFSSGELVFGKSDKLPIRIATDVEGEFKKFCEFTIKAIKALPADSHLLIAALFKKGTVKQVFTDNMDDILGKVSVPYIRTRLSIFPDRFPAQFDPNVKSLLVVGVAVDRRDVIKQARRAGLKIIAINPVMGVAPHSRNMDYLRKGDLLFRETAQKALPKIIEASGF